MYTQSPIIQTPQPFQSTACTCIVRLSGKISLLALHVSATFAILFSKVIQQLSSPSLSIFVSIAIATLLLTSCMAIKYPPRNNLVEMNGQLSALDGHYKNFNKLPERETISMMGMLAHKNKVGQPITRQFDDLSAYVTLKAQGNKRLLVTLHQDSTTMLAQVLLKGRVRNNYFVMRRRFRYFGIPLLFHTTASFKLQMGLDLNNQLHIDALTESGGCALLFCAGGPTHYNLTYKRSTSE